MLYKSYSEFYKELANEFDSFDVILGTTKNGVSIMKNTIFINLVNIDFLNSDDVYEVQSVDYELIIMTNESTLKNKKLALLTNNGFRYQGYNQDVDKHIYTADVTLWHFDGLPEDIWYGKCRWKFKEDS